MRFRNLTVRFIHFLVCFRIELGHNLCMAFNSIFQEPCDIGKIKQLIF